MSPSSARSQDPVDTTGDEMPPPPDDFEQFVHASADRLLRAALVLTGGRRDQAEDLVQSAYATVFTKWRLVARADDPLAYSRVILTRTFLDERRRRRPRLSRLDERAEAPAPTADPSTRMALLDAVAGLAPLDRAVVMLRYYEDLSVAETADLLGLSTAACRTRASRALSRLRADHPDLHPLDDATGQDPT